MHRVALISEYASPLTDPRRVAVSGGEHEYVAQIARQLPATGYAVDVFTRRTDPHAPEVVRWKPNVRVIHVDGGPHRPVAREELLPYMHGFADNMLRFMRRQSLRYRVVHSSFWLSALVAARVKEATDIPFVATLHTLGRVRRLHRARADRFPVSRLWIEDRIIREAAAVIATSPQQTGELIELYDAPNEHVHTIPGAVDGDRFRPVSRAAARAIIGEDGPQPLLLTVGRLVPRKGCADVIRAVGLLRREYGIDARLLVVGGNTFEPDERMTPELTDLRILTLELDVPDLVSFVGHRDGDTLRYYYNAADVFVAAPWYEPFGMAPLEAMACGTPVVATNVGGIKFTVRDGGTGLLVPPRDARALAGAIARLIRSPETRATFAERGRDRARARFSWADVVEKIARLYDRVAAGPIGTYRTPGVAAAASIVPLRPFRKPGRAS